MIGNYRHGTGSICRECRMCPVTIREISEGRQDITTGTSYLSPYPSLSQSIYLHVNIIDHYRAGIQKHDAV